MSVPLSQMLTVTTYVLGQRLRGRRRYPLVLMLEPLFRCNLACAGCGKIQYPAHILSKNLSVEQCLAAVEECGAPMVSIPGGEPLMYPDIGRPREGAGRPPQVRLPLHQRHPAQGEARGQFTPSKYLSFSVHLDGLREEHDERCAGRASTTGRGSHPRGAAPRLPRDDQHDALRRRVATACASSSTR